MWIIEYTTTNKINNNVGLGGDLRKFNGRHIDEGRLLIQARPGVVGQLDDGDHIEGRRFAGTVSLFLLGPAGWDVASTSQGTAPSRARGARLYRPPSDAAPAARDRFRAWARARGIELREERLQAQTYFACIELMDAAEHIGRYPYRDYLLGTLDHASGLSPFLPIYPRAGVGPDQRYRVKGGNVIEASGAAEPRWFTP